MPPCSAASASIKEPPRSRRFTEDVLTVGRQYELREKLAACRRSENLLVSNTVKPAFSMRLDNVGVGEGQRVLIHVLAAPGVGALAYQPSRMMPPWYSTRKSFVEITRLLGYRGAVHPANRAALRCTTSRVFAMSTAMPGRATVAKVRSAAC
jgi:hypothetical protein